MNKALRVKVRYFALFFVLVALCSNPFAAQAKQPVTKITLDEATRQSGYTLTRGRLQLGIQPTSLANATKAWVRKVKNIPVLPDHLIALSPAYSFTLLNEASELEVPLKFRYQLRGKKYRYDRFFYYYDVTTSSWVKLDSALQRTAGTLTTQWGVPHGMVIIAADTTDPFGPQQIAGFTDFGNINAAAAIAIDESTGDVLYSYNSTTKRSMASMTKLMTAYVLFQQGVDLNAIATYHTSYNQEGGALLVTEGETMTMGDLMNAMVVGSANNAAYALVGNAGYNLPDFIDLMNATAVELSLDDTTFADPSGLAVENITTAADYARLMKAVLQNTTLAEISATPYYAFTTINYGKFHDFNNTNSLLWTSSLDITGSKTGFIYEALYCLAMRVQQNEHSIITVVMGAPTLSERTNESARLVNWAFKNYIW